MTERVPRPAAGDDVRGALAAAAARFTFSPTARLDAELLMAHALGTVRNVVLMRYLDDPVPPGFAALADRRAAQEPVAYITGTRGFWTIDLAVGPGALVPRADSEALIEAAIGLGRTPATILDLGTGPGTLLLALLDRWPQARGLGVDASAVALGYARANTAALGLGARAAFVRGDWAASIDARFDLIVANPPYIGTGERLPREVHAYEPSEALFAGPDGLAAYRRIVPQIAGLLAPGGTALFEVGATQHEAVGTVLTRAGFDVAWARDLAGHMRVAIAT